MLDVNTTLGHPGIALKTVGHSNIRFRSSSTANCYLSRGNPMVTPHPDKYKNVKGHLQSRWINKEAHP
ncbi:hypothetical protein A2U01_0038269 [Trifolium medium]|uniref:Uncharacterized protein n=1 Tax=Trifolium medium TaxID=97028 RepID=A0A392PZN7_9FABA|nr:hypothetical protein [Trifolium medium]